MVTIPRKIYYLIANGKFICDTGESTGEGLKPTTTEEDFRIFKALQPYQRDAVGVIELQVGQYREDFNICDSFKIDVVTKDIIFYYRDENTGVVEERVPLEVRVENLQAENQYLGMELSEREILGIVQGQQISDLEIRLLMGGL